MRDTFIPETHDAEDEICAERGKEQGDRATALKKHAEKGSPPWWFPSGCPTPASQQTLLSEKHPTTFGASLVKCDHRIRYPEKASTKGKKALEEAETAWGIDTSWGKSNKCSGRDRRGFRTRTGCYE